MKKISENTKKMKITRLDKVLLRCLDDMIKSNWALKIIAGFVFIIVLIPVLFYESVKAIFETIIRLKHIRENREYYEEYK